MREIKFRGKRTDTGEWVIGGFTLDVIDKPRIIVKDSSGHWLVFHHVLPETVGEYTGLHVYNLASELKELYEGDIVENTKGFVGIITLRKTNAQFIALDKYGKTYSELDATSGSDIYVCEQYKLIGNIYENPELLK